MPNYYCGIDIGASAAKLAIIDDQYRMVARSTRRSGVDYAQTAESCRDEALAAAGLKLSQIGRAVSTGYGRDNVPWVAGKMTEIACHGRGAYHTYRTAITVLDIGAQDCKVIHLDAHGYRTGFKMNRKCAAGTGSFLEEIAYRLDLKLSDLNGLAERSTKEVALGSFCTVFAATEVLEKILRGPARGGHHQGGVSLRGQSRPGDGRGDRHAGDDRRRGRVQPGTGPARGRGVRVSGLRTARTAIRRRPGCGAFRCGNGRYSSFPW